MISIQNLVVNTSRSNFLSKNLHIDEDGCPVDEKPQHIDFDGLRIDKLSWRILHEIYLITLTYKRDYCYTAQEISDRLKSKNVKYCGLRSVEKALQSLQSILLFIRISTKKYPVQHGKEKFRGLYRELTEKGLAFIEYRFSERERIKEERLKNRNAELNAELINREPYCHVASEPVSKINLKIIRSNLDLSVRCSRDERFDFANACFEEYAQQMSNAQPYIEQEVLQEEIYEPVQPRYRPVVKKLLDESGLDNERKEEVIQAVYRQQNCNTKIISISGVTKKFIAEARVRQREKHRCDSHASYKPFVFIEMTEEERQKSKRVSLDEIRKMRASLN